MSSLACFSIAPRIFFVFVLIALSSFSHGALYKCLSDEGLVEFKDMPCAQGMKQSALSTDYDSRGFLKKWFAFPKVSTPTTRCTAKQCTCGNREQKYGQFVDRDIASSVNSLIFAWGNFQDQHRAITREGKPSKYQISKLKDMACEIRIQQKIFNMSYQKMQDELQTFQINSSKLSNINDSCQQQEADYQKALKAYRDNWNNGIRTDLPKKQHYNIRDCKSDMGEDLRRFEYRQSSSNQKIKRMQAQLERLK